MANEAKSELAGRYDLTPADIELCDSFQDLLKRVVGGNAGCVSASVSWIARGNYPDFPTASVQDRHEAFSGEYAPRRISVQLQDSINRLRAANPNEEERKAKRVAELKAELERLEATVKVAA